MSLGTPENSAIQKLSIIIIIIGVLTYILSSSFQSQHYGLHIIIVIVLRAETRSHANATELHTYNTCCRGNSLQKFQQFYQFLRSVSSATNPKVVYLDYA